MGLFTDGFKLLKKASEPLYKTPKAIQETIEIMAVAENGIFEVSKNKYSKCYRFQDINYTTATEDEQIGIFERYCKFLNSLDCNYKITINNKNKNMDELRDKVLIAEKNDGFNNYRRIYNDIIEEKIIEGRQGIEQERYLTITIERKNFEEAKAQFATLEATIHNLDIGWETADEYLYGNVRDKLKLSGGDIKAVQGDSCHAQADMVTEVYGHILDEDRKKNAQLMENAFYNKENLNPDIHGASGTQNNNNNNMISIPEGVEADMLMKVLGNPEMAALLTSLAKSIKG